MAQSQNPMTRGKQQINSSSSGSRPRERKTAQMEVHSHLKGMCLYDTFFNSTAPITASPWRNEKWLLIREKTICPLWATFIINGLACVLWPSLTSGVSGVKAKPSIATKQIRLERQSSAQSAREQDEAERDIKQMDRRVRRKWQEEIYAYSTDPKCFM